MNYAYSLGAAGVVSAMYRQDVAANNLANLNTTGFKPDRAFTLPREAARREDGLSSLPSNAMLERLGAGVLLAPNRTDFRQGAVEPSRNPFDLAIDGPGFLTVAAGEGGGTGPEATRLTRDGRLTLDPRGRLVTATGGHAVLDDSGRPITLDPARDFTVDSSGAITQGGAAVATLGFVDVADPQSLRKVGTSLYAPPSPLTPSTAPSAAARGGKIVQSATEASAVDPIRAMMAVQDAASSVGTAVRMMQLSDELMGRAINTLGKVTA